jgi:rubrerythrin
MGVGTHGMTTYQWGDDQRTKELASQRWNCVYCKTVNRWMTGDKPPEKCRSCGAPERA